MKNRTTRRPYSRPRQRIARNRRSGQNNGQTPVFQPLEPRKLLTTLYANADPALGQTNVFTGFIAMPRFITNFDELLDLDASDVEERSFRVQISLFDSNPFSEASVTILDLNGNTLFPWAGQPDGNGGFTTEIDVPDNSDPMEPAVGEDGYWGTEDDKTVSVFGLDGGFIPGWKFLPGLDETLFTADDIIVPDGYFNPVRSITYEEELEEETIVDLDFDGGLPPEVTVDNIGGGNINWTTNDQIPGQGEGNYTGGDAEAATASVRQGGGAFDTAIQFGANLTGWNSGRLEFKLNYQNFANDRLDVEVSADNGNNWSLLKSYAEDHGGNRTNNSGEDVALDLTQFADQNILIRFRYHGPDGNAIYAQIDDVQVTGILSGWQTDDIPDDFTVVVPQTGYWLPGMDGIYNGGTQWETKYPLGPFLNSIEAQIKNFGWSPVADDTRLPLGFDGGGSDERLPNGEDGSTWLQLDPTDHDPWRRPTTDDTDFHLVDITLDPTINPALAAWAGSNPDRARHSLGIANDGIADFNNGIGQIIFNNTSASTIFTISIIDEDGSIIDQFQISENDKIGVDIDRTATGEPDVIQPLGMGQAIVGNPTNVDWTANSINGDPILPSGIGGRGTIGRNGSWVVFGEGWQDWQGKLDPNFPARLPEGISFADPSANNTMGRVQIDGMLFGTNRFPAALETLHVGYLGGAVIVDGELDAVIVAGDSGFIQYITDPSVVGDTGALVQTGRNIGTYLVAGTTCTELNVIGELNETIDRPKLREAQQTVLEHENDLHLTDQIGYVRTFVVGGTRWVLPAGGEDEEQVQYLTNDTLGTAQFINRLTGRTELFGTIGATPLVGPHTGGDAEDYFAIAVDGRAEIRIAIFDQRTGLDLVAELTIVDEFGNIVASRGQDGTQGQVTWTPNQAGLYYIHVNNTNSLTNVPYRMVVQGLESVSLGEYTAYRPMRFVADGSKNVITRFGSIGTVRAGQDSIEATQAWMGNISIDSAADLWNVTAGSSIGLNVDDSATGTANPIFFSAARDIGTILAGVGLGEGDGTLLGGSIVSGAINAGNNISGIYAYASSDSPRDYGDIGGVAVNNSVDAIGDELTSALDIIAGNRIGVIHADNRLYGGDPTAAARIFYGPSGGVDLIEASATMFDTEHTGNRDLDMEARASGIVGINGIPLILASTSPGGGNVRFVRTPYAFSVLNDDDHITLGPDQQMTLVDDSGATFTVKVTAGTTFGGDSTSAVRIVTQPVRASQGAAVTRIIANLHFGADLIITNNSGNVEIGDVIVVSNGQLFDSGSNVIINGSGRTDIYMLRAIGRFDSIRNTTSGDIVALDIGGAKEVDWHGNMGRIRHLTDIGPKMIGPDLGPIGGVSEPGFGEGSGVQLIGGGPVQVAWVVGGALGVDPAAGGAPYDRWLNGLSIRATTYADLVENIRIDGTLADAIVQTYVENIVVNADGFTPFDDFHGVEGVVFARGNIERINVGDGVLPHTKKGPSLTAGVFAVGQLEQVIVEGPGHDIRGPIGGRAQDLLNNARINLDYGIGSIEAKDGANVWGAVISTQGFGDFWTPGGGDSLPVADINQIKIQDGSLIDCIIRAVAFNTVDIKGGVWDANILTAITDIGRLRADAFRDTTDTTLSTGTNFFGFDNANTISGSGSLDRIETNGRAGDISDLYIDLQANLDKVRAFNIHGLTLEVDNIVSQVDAKGSLSRSFFLAGTVDRIQAQEDIARLTVNVAGPIKKFSAKQGSITQLDLVVDGPDGELNKIDAQNDIAGSIQVSGQISKIQAKNGDINGYIRTFSGDGDIKQLKADRDMLAEMDIDGGIQKIQVGRNLGDGRRILIRGDANKIDVKNGALQANLVTEGMLKKLDVQTWTAGTTATAEGEMKKISINSDVDGSIVSYRDGINKIDINGSFLGTSGNKIAAYESGIKNLTINGNAAGLIYADKELSKIDIKSTGGGGGGEDDGDGNLTGVVHSRTNIENLNVDGSATGAYIQALHALEKVQIGGSVTGTVFGGGVVIENIDVRGQLANSFVLAGLENLGEDRALGGTLAANRDIFSSGTLERVDVGNGIDHVVFAAGVSAGTDGNYSTVDANTDLLPGKSVIESIRVGGAAVNGNMVLADTAIQDLSFEDTSPDVAVRVLNYDLPSLPGTGTQANFSDGNPVVFTEADGDTIFITLNGAGSGTVEYDAGKHITGIVLEGTDSKSDLSIGVSQSKALSNRMVDFTGSAFIAVADDADLNSAIINGKFVGSSSLRIDGNVDDVYLAETNTTGSVALGGETGSFTLGKSTAGTFNITRVNDVAVNGAFAGTMKSEYIDSFYAAGNVSNATIYGRDGVDSFKTDGAFGVDPPGPGFSPAYLVTNVAISSFTAASTAQAIIAAGDYLGNVNVDGSVVDTQFLGGLILGNDARYGGSGQGTDRVTAGIIDKVNIKNDLTRTSIAAGVRPGPDAYFGTTDDIGAVGYSAINGITIGGNATGSTVFSQNFAFIATDELSTPKVQGRDFNRQGNLETEIFGTTPVAPEVVNSSVRLEGQTFYADIFMSEAANSSTIIPKQGTTSAVSIESAEGGADPKEGTDYFVTYDVNEKRISIQFDRTFTTNNAGIYTITLDGETLISRSGIRLDGNRDGIPGDDYAFNILLGDAGDRTTEQQAWDHDNNPNTDPITFKAPVDLDLILEDQNGSLGTKNHRVRLVEVLGDHPEHDPVFFPDKLDVDLYQFTLEAGDILQAELGALPGSGFFGTISLRGSDGSAFVTNATTLAAGVVIQQDGTYILEVTGGGAGHLQSALNTGQDLDINNGTGFFDAMGNPIDPNTIVNDSGRYYLDVLIFDDGDTGFDRGTKLTLTNRQTQRYESWIGLEDTVGYATIDLNAFNDVDIFTIDKVKTNSGTVDQLLEGTTVSLRLSIEEFGSDFGNIELALFNIDNPSTVYDALLVGGAGDIADNPGYRDVTLDLKIPEKGRYAILVQGRVEANYALEVYVDVSTAGDRYAQARVQNVLLETNGGVIDWLDRFPTDVIPFSLDQLGFENSETVILQGLIQQIEDKFDNAGVTVNVSTDVTDFGGGEFTTVFLSSNYGDENFFGPVLGISESLDPLNQKEDEQVIIFVNSHNFFGPAEEDQLTTALANTISHELGHSFGLRHDIVDPLSLYGVMRPSLNPFSPPLQFDGDNDLPLAEFFLGLENEVQLLHWIFDADDA